MAGYFGDRINSRGDFLRELSAAQALSAKIAARRPHQAPIKFAEKKLAEIARWTGNGVTPTLDERRSVRIALLLHREYETTDDDEILALREMVSGIDSYVTYWPDDKCAADPRNPEYLFLADVLYD